MVGQLPAFELTNQDGEPFGTQQMKGEVWVVGFFFVECRTLCPRILAAMNTLEGFIEPVYIRTAPLTDGWTRTFQVASVIGEYTVCSGGKDGGTCTGDGAGATQSFNDSITFTSGQFVQWPEGTQQ